MTTYTFGERAAREIMRQLRILMRRTDRVESLARRSAKRVASAPSIEFAKPKTTLQVGSTCEAFLMPWNGTSYAKIEGLSIDIEDLHSWAFAIGTDSWASSPHVLPVVESPKRGVFEVVYPFGLMQQGKPDSNISSGSSGTVSIYAGNTDTTVNVTGYVDWAEGGEQVGSGKESWWAYSMEQSRWNWAGGACE